MHPASPSPSRSFCPTPTTVCLIKIVFEKTCCVVWIPWRISLLREVGPEEKAGSELLVALNTRSLFSFTFTSAACRFYTFRKPSPFKVQRRRSFSAMTNSESSPPPRDPPHIRLNSGQDNIIITDASNSRPAAPTRPQSLRSLVPQQRPPTTGSIRVRPLLPGVYSSGPAESAELLLPPSRQRARRFRDEDSVPGSPIDSSRRTSWSSEQNRDSRLYGMNPFEDSRTPSRAGSDDDNIVNTQTVSEKYNILPSAGLLLFPEDVEKDDYLHNPDPNEKEGRECDIFTKRGLANVGGLGLIVLGLLVLFIGYPIL